MSNGKPPDFKFLADQILAYTKVDVNPKIPSPGERMTVETIPGILPFIPSDLAGSLNLPLTGPVDVLLQALIRAVHFSVKYKVMVDGKELSSLKLEPLTPLSLPDSDPLMALFRIAPPLVPDYRAHVPVKVEFVATVRVDVEGNVNEKSVTIPLDVAPIPIPTLLVLTGNNKVFAMARAGSGVTDLSGAVGAINSVVQALNKVKDLLSWGPALDLLLGGLGDAASRIASGGPAGFAVEEAPDLDDYNDFDDEADAALLIGPVGTQVRFYSGEEYNELAGGENERTTITLTDLGAPFGIATGFGLHKESGWQSTRMWDTDSDDDMDDVESCRFFDPGDPAHPGDPEYS